MWAFGSSDFTFQYNYCEGTKQILYDGQPWDFDLNNSGTCIYQYNLSRDNEGGFLLSGNETTAGYHKICRYNISINDGSKQGNGEGFFNGTCDHYNNVFYRDDGKGFIQDGIGSPLHGLFLNNVFITTASSDISYQGATRIFSNNCFYGHSPVNAGANPITSAPMFVDQATAITAHARSAVSGFQLQAGSSLINHGVNIAGNGGKDFWGNALSDGATDIGAYEYPASATNSGSLIGAGVAGGTSTIDLTTEGTDDWAHWGFSGTGIDHKSVSGSAVSHITETHVGSPLQYADNTNGYSWTDGTPTVNAVATRTGIYIVGSGNSFTITVPADMSTRTVKAYVGGWMSAGTLTAHLSDNSAADYTDSSFSNNAASYCAVYTITYKAGASNQSLTVRWQMASGPAGGNVTLQAATLQVGGGSVPAPVMSIAPKTNQAGTIELSWPSVSGAIYAVYKTTNLLVGWPAQPVTNNISGSGTTILFWEPMGTLPAAYYRLKAAGN
jgi:hypothetical protein